MLKYITQFEISYWFNRKVECDLYWRIHDSRKELAFSVFDYSRIDAEKYEHEWGTNWWKHFTLWKCNK